MLEAGTSIEIVGDGTGSGAALQPPSAQIAAKARSKTAKSAFRERIGFMCFSLFVSSKKRSVVT